LKFRISINGKNFPISNLPKMEIISHEISDFKNKFILGMLHPFPLQQNTVLSVLSFLGTGLDEIFVNLPPTPKWPPQG
jgi:hypothetical protein